MKLAEVMVICRRMLVALCAAGMALMAVPADASRIKDVVAFEGVRDNMLMGYGLVVGLNGTGDKLQNNAFTEQSLIAFLERQGVNTRGLELKSKNVAAVTVTARLPAFARAGSTLDVTISAMGDAKSLLGGTLLATSLYGPDGNVYSVAQGTVNIGGFEASGESGTSITKGVPTNGFIPNGALVEREIDFRLNELKSVRLALRNPDVTTAHSIAKVINLQVGPGTSQVEDPGTVLVSVPTAYQGDVSGLLADIETLKVETDQPARIVVDEATGTIVMGDNVRISTVAVAQGNLVVKVEETPQVSQPNPFAPEGAETVVVPRTDVTVSEQAGNKLAILEEGATLRDLVAGLNALGVGPRDLITILQTIKAAGALQADIETR
jgi:flagellar P-ring protein FlgI